MGKKLVHQCRGGVIFPMGRAGRVEGEIGL